MGPPGAAFGSEAIGGFDTGKLKKVDFVQIQLSHELFIPGWFVRDLYYLKLPNLLGIMITNDNL